MLIRKLLLPGDFDKMRKVIFLFSFAVLGVHTYAQDIIIYRDGRMRQVKIIQTNNDKTLVKEWGKKHAAEEMIDNAKVFMLKFKTRGNVVFDGKGERILATSEPVQIPKDAIVVYYKDGREVPAYNLTMDADILSFKTSKPGKKRDNSRPVYSPRTDVFMISYPDGTRDILSILAIEEEDHKQREAAEANVQQEAEPADSSATAEDDVQVSEPQKATIVTKAGTKLKVWICGDTPSEVSYKKTNTPKAAIFRMSKSKIKRIIY